VLVSGVALLSLAGIAAASFASTNVDNLVLTTAQVAAAPAHRTRRIVIGQLLGFAVIVLIGVIVATALFEIPTRWIGLLGLVPLALGIRGLLALRRASGDRATKWPLAAGLWTSALITIGNGGDNLAVSIPLLRESSGADRALVVAIFVVLDVLLCTIAVLAGRHPRTVRGIERFGVLATPVLYCVIGVVVLVRAGTFSSLG